MYTDEDLYAAVKDGVLDETAVERFRSFVSGRAHTRLVDEENFRLISGFNDIFVSIDFIDERFEPEAVLRRIRAVTDQCERVSSLRAHVSAHK